MEFGGFVLEIKKYLEDTGIDTESGYSYLQYKRRQYGHEFAFNEHCEAMVLSMLSANRPWKKIEESKELLREVFHDYDADYLRTANPTDLTYFVQDIGCGNRAIAKQMNGLAHNVEVLQYIQNYLNTPIDYIVSHSNPLQIAELLQTDHCKMENMAHALCLQYQRNVGIDTFKPDVHIRRILFRQGLISTDTASIETIGEVFDVLHEELQMPITLINDLIWCYCATGYGEICTSSPSCNSCIVTDCWYKRYMRI